MVHADPVRLAQVFGNLLNNAAKYTPDGGTHRTSTSTREHGAVTVCACATTASASRADMLPRIFELFSQVERHLDRRPGRTRHRPDAGAPA